jgi:hypothetical protein
MAVTVAMAPRSCIKLTIPLLFGDDGVWALGDDTAGTLSCDSTTGVAAVEGGCANNRVRIYCHGDTVGIQKVTYTVRDSYCICNIVTTIPHDHSDMYHGGPAYGVYKSD